MELKWIPGRGPDADAIARMKQHFAQPKEAPPEAWFMDPSNQSYYWWIFETPADQHTDTEMDWFLYGISGGLRLFFRLDKWVESYLYVLPYVIERIDEKTSGDLTSVAITCFLNIYVDGFVEEYPGFREDVFATLPHIIMKPFLWESGRLKTEHWWLDDWAGYFFSCFHGTMFFCLTHLSPREIPAWVASFAAIHDETWQRLCVKWTKGFQQFLTYVEHPENLPEWIEPIPEEDKSSLEYRIVAAKIDWYTDFNTLGRWIRVEVTDDYTVDYYGRKILQWFRPLSDYISDEKITTFLSEIQKYPQFKEQDIP
jgi:hypothetical protein